MIMKKKSTKVIELEIHTDIPNKILNQITEVSFTTSDQLDLESPEKIIFDRARGSLRSVHINVPSKTKNKEAE
jgi:hypothetical protein